ncbi:MAG: hypothetical protein KC609_08930 [Myxococcales bacterium]|nr:hypothetical protein [Myxococcales bacterium]
MMTLNRWKRAALRLLLTLLLVVGPCAAALAEGSNPGTLSVETEGGDGTLLAVETDVECAYVFDAWGGIDAVTLTAVVPLSADKRETAELRFDLDLQPKQQLYYSWIRNLTIDYRELVDGVERPGIFSAEGTVRVLESVADSKGLTLHLTFEIEVQQQLEDQSWNTIRHFRNGEALATTHLGPNEQPGPTTGPSPVLVPVVLHDDPVPELPDVVVTSDGISNGCDGEDYNSYDDYDGEPQPDAYDNGGGCTGDPGTESSSPGPSCDGNDNGSYDSEASSAPDGNCSLRRGRCRGRACRLPRAYLIALRLAPFFFALLFVLALKRRSLHLADGSPVS